MTYKCLLNSPSRTVCRCLIYMELFLAGGSFDDTARKRAAWIAVVAVSLCSFKTALHGFVRTYFSCQLAAIIPHFSYFRRTRLSPPLEHIPADALLPEHLPAKVRHRWVTGRGGEIIHLTPTSLVLTDTRIGVDYSEILCIFPQSQRNRFQLPPDYLVGP